MATLRKQADVNNPTGTPPTRTVSGMPNHEALTLLPLPVQLSTRQREGHVCVWGGEALTTETAVDLGSRKLDDRMVFPRACHPCIGKQALRALTDHNLGPQACATCATGMCDTSRALNRLIRIGHR